MKFSNLLCGGACVALLAAAYARPAGADEYPNKPIRFICTYAPGGGTDITARAVAQQLTGILGQSVVVENRPGAGGTIGADYVAKSAPDGYTIMLGSASPMVMSRFLFKALPYDALKDFAPITLIAIVPDALAVHPSLPVKSLDDLVRLARAHPHELTFGSSGIGGSGHLAGQLLMSTAKIDMIHVPYKGTAPAMVAVLSGEVTMEFPDVLAVLAPYKAGKLKVLAVTSEKRLDALPGIPAIAETYPGYVAGPWYSVVAPAGTPPAIVDRLNKAIVQALHDPKLAASFTDHGAQLVGDTPAQLAQFLQQETVRWGKVIRDAGVRAN